MRWSTSLNFIKKPNSMLIVRLEDQIHCILNLVREARVGALIATHNTELARHMDRRLRLQDGALTEE